VCGGPTVPGPSRGPRSPSACFEDQKRCAREGQQRADHHQCRIDPSAHASRHAVAGEIKLSPKELCQLDCGPDGGNREAPECPSFRSSPAPGRAEDRRPFLDQHLDSEANEREENTELADKPLTFLSHGAGCGNLKSLCRSRSTRTSSIPDEGANMLRGVERVHQTPGSERAVHGSMSTTGASTSPQDPRRAIDTDGPPRDGRS